MRYRRPQVFEHSRTVLSFFFDVSDVSLSVVRKAQRQAHRGVRPGRHAVVLQQRDTNVQSVRSSEIPH